MMDYYGETYVSTTGIERYLLINSDDSRECDIMIRPIDEALTRTDGEVSIPLDKVYINNSHEDVYFRYNDYSTLLTKVTLGGVQKMLTARVRDYGMVPAGTYTLNFEIKALDSETQEFIAATSFNLHFVVPVQQQLNFNGAMSRITIGADSVFAKNKKIVTDENPIVYINSNCDWELVLNMERFGEGAGNYYVRVMAASANVNYRLNERTQVYPDSEIVLARGKAPANNEYISLEFAVQGKDGKIIKSGTYRNYLKFILKEDRG